MCQATFYITMHNMLSRKQDQDRLTNYMGDTSEKRVSEERHEKHLNKTRHKENSFWELMKFAILALLIVIPIRIFIAQPFIVNGSSMVPTFENGEYLIVDEISYRFSEPERGDIIIFRFPRDKSKFFIKRIIGLPSETIIIKGSVVTIKNAEYRGGFVLHEPYIKHEANNHLEVDLGENEYFVMGDNRLASSDSRIWGTLPQKLIIGRAFLRLLPIAEAAYLPGDYKL